jgi:hypothetical protein
MSEKRSARRRRPPAKEFCFTERGKRGDAELHAPILAEGDHEAAAAVSRDVMKRLGIAQHRIDKLLGKT